MKEIKYREVWQIQILGNLNMASVFNILFLCKFSWRCEFLLELRLFLSGDRRKNDCGASVDWRWQGKSEVLADYPVPVPLSLTSFPHELHWQRTQSSAVKSVRHGKLYLQNGPLWNTRASRFSLRGKFALWSGMWASGPIHIIGKVTFQSTASQTFVTAFEYRHFPDLRSSNDPECPAQVEFCTSPNSASIWLSTCVYIQDYFSFHWHYSPLWALACRAISFHFFLSVTSSLHHL
jgi:hypothetical protein